MSSITITTPHKPATHQAIRQKLNQLRRRLILWVLADGLSRVGLVALALIALDAFIDRFFRMDFSQRLIMLCLMVGIVVGVAIWRIVLPLLKLPSEDALALQLEQQRRDLGETVISALQFSRKGRHDHAHASPALVEATIARGVELIRGIDPGTLINGSRLKLNTIILAATAIVFAALIWGIANTDFWRIWFQRNVLLGSQTWPLSTTLLLHGLEDGRLRLPRGEDHTQIVEIDPDSRITQVDVVLDIDDGHTRRTQRMERTLRHAGREFQWTFRAVNQPLRFRARGGDHTTQWVRIELVEPPTLDEIEIVAHLPEYTNQPPEKFSQIASPYSVLEGSSLEIRARSNKPLENAVLRSEDRRWSLTGGDPTRWTALIPAADLRASTYTFELTDTEGFTSPRPPTFSLRLRPDRAPRVRANLLGISGIVTPQAQIPISYAAVDEFAISRLDLLFQSRAAEDQGTPQQGMTPIPEAQGELGNPELQGVTMMDLQPLQLEPGVTVRLLVQATDNNTRSGPGEGQSRDFLLRVVSEDELRADLLRREIELRKMFEASITQQEEIVVQLQGVADEAQQGAAATAQSRDAWRSQLINMHRRQRGIGTATANIADRFEQLLVEAENNRLDEDPAGLEGAQSISQRLDSLIIQPLRTLDADHVARASQRLDLAMRQVNNQNELPGTLQQAIEVQQALLERMRQILAAMQDSETYQEVVNRAIEVRRSQQQLREMTRKRQQQARERDLFDDDLEEP